MFIFVFSTIPNIALFVKTVLMKTKSTFQLQCFIMSLCHLILVSYKIGYNNLKIFVMKRSKSNFAENRFDEMRACVLENVG